MTTITTFLGALCCGGRVIAAVVLAGAVAGCGAGSGAAGYTSTADPPSAPPGGAVVMAQHYAFDRATITVPAGRSVPLLFESRDGVPHNVTILARDGSTVFVGETFGGPATKVYDLPALSAGTYRFRCDVHTDMAGILIADGTT
jgi:plastocyanin